MGGYGIKLGPNSGLVLFASAIELKVVEALQARTIAAKPRAHLSFFHPEWQRWLLSWLYFWGFN
jgi:hypothetical protein